MSILKSAVERYQTGNQRKTLRLFGVKSIFIKYRFNLKSRAHAAGKDCETTSTRKQIGNKMSPSQKRRTAILILGRGMGRGLRYKYDRWESQGPQPGGEFSLTHKLSYRPSLNAWV